jgi:hypothetical protein
MNERSYTSTPPTFPQGVERDNFAFDIGLLVK